MSSIQDIAKGLFDKGYDAASSVALKAKIKTQIADQNLACDNLMRKLGYAVYEEVARDPHYTDTFPELFTKIEEVKARKQALEDEYARIVAEEERMTPPQGEPIIVEAEVSEEDAQ